jgi:C4-dicarboxylate transporter DctM subunit
MNIGILLIIILLLFSLLGMPVAFAIGIASMVCVFYGDYQISVLAQKMFSGVDSFILLAIPYFVLAGNIMSAGGITKRILAFSAEAFGWLKGSLAIITVTSSAIFAALTGSGVATTSAIGGITIPAMKEEGYDLHFATAVAANGGILGPLIPPSIFLITYGNSAEMDINALFKAAVVPGVLLALLLIIYVYIYACRHHLKSGKTFNLKKTAKATKDGIWALLMPLLLLGLIFSGITTPTEAAAVACVYTFIVAVFIYKTIDAKKTFKVLEESAVATALMMFLMGNSKISGWVLAIGKVPEVIANGILSISSSAFVIMLAINIFLLVVGMFMEGNAAIVILTPILLPLALQCGISGVQFGIILCVNLCMGLVTPPVGGCLHIGNMIGNGRIELTFIRSIPFLLVETIVLILVNVCEPLISFFPNLVSKI